MKTNYKPVKQIIFLSMSKREAKKHLACGLIFIALSGCQFNSQPTQTQPIPSAISVTTNIKQTADSALRDDLLLWMKQAQKIVQLTGVSPPAAARWYAYTGLALHLALSPDSDLREKLTGLKPLPVSAEAKDKRAYLHGALSTFLPEVILASARQRQLIQEMDQLQRRSFDFQTTAAQQSLDAGQELGRHLAQWAREDGYVRTRSLTYSSPARNQNPAFWAPTAPSQKALEPYWGSLRPFLMPSGNRCHVAETVSFSKDPGSDFYQQAQEVLDTQQTLTPEQTAIARWWADNPGESATPPGHWVSIAVQLLKERHHDAQSSARILAILGMTLSDAFVSCWQSKYQVNLLRPMTYIREYLNQPLWKPFLTTPPFPEFPSGHSVASGAAAEVLSDLLGSGEFLDQTHVPRGQKARPFKSFRAAADEAGISRLYGGIHYRDAIEQGLKQGRCIGQGILERIGPLE